MNTTDKHTSEGRGRPVSISSTSSLDNLLMTENSSFDFDKAYELDPISESQFGQMASESRSENAANISALPQGHNMKNSSTPNMQGSSEIHAKGEQHDSSQQNNGALGTRVASASSVSLSPAALGGSNTSNQSSTIPSMQLPPQQTPNEALETAAAAAAVSMPLSSASQSSVPPANSYDTSATSQTLQLAPPEGNTAPQTQAPEFLYQLTKMLTDNNRDTIEWNMGKIEVHSPHRLEAKVLHKYFRHSKFASFQRQLNYFGFRKQAGKGKMAPCSYVNENLPSTDLSCLLHIKRKTSVSTSAKEKQPKKPKTPSTSMATTAGNVNPVLAGILQRSTQGQRPQGQTVNNGAVRKSSDPSVPSHIAVAQAAVGRGIRHNYTARLPPNVPTATPRRDVNPPMTASPVNPRGAARSYSSSSQVQTQPAPSGTRTSSTPLSQLVTNYQNTLQDMSSSNAPAESTDPTPLNEMQEPYSGFLSREDSLIDLAMIPIVDYSGEQSEPALEDGAQNEDDISFNFIDFPNPDVYPTGGNRKNIS